MEIEILLENIKKNISEAPKNPPLYLLEITAGKVKSFFLHYWSYFSEKIESILEKFDYGDKNSFLKRSIKIVLLPIFVCALYLFFNSSFLTYTLFKYLLSFLEKSDIPFKEEISSFLFAAIQTFSLSNLITTAFKLLLFSLVIGEIFPLYQSLKKFTTRNIKEKLNTLENHLRSFDQDYENLLKEINTHLDDLKKYKEPLSSENITKLQSLRKRLDYHCSNQLKKILDLHDLAKHKSPEMMIYFESKKLLKPSFSLEVKKIVANIFFNPSCQWKLNKQPCITHASEFLNLQKSLKENFNIDICYKEILFFQMRTHKLYCPELADTSQSVFNNTYIQNNLKDLMKILLVISDLGCDERLQRYQCLRQLVKSFSRESDYKEKFIYNPYLTEDFFNTIKEICQVTDEPQKNNYFNGGKIVKILNEPETQKNKIFSQPFCENLTTIKNTQEGVKK